jgi:Spy/CpxP family protein refolding chaperone
MKKLMLLIVALLLCLPLSGYSQPGMDEDPSVIMPQRRERVEKRVQTMRMWKMTEELNLSEEQSTKFLPLLNEMDRKMEVIRHSRQEALGKLGDLSWDTKAKSEEINKLLDNLEDLEAQQMALRKQFRKDVSGILMPDQIGRMVLFNLRFPEMMRESIRDFEGRHGDDLPPPPPRGERRGW